MKELPAERRVGAFPLNRLCGLAFMLCTVVASAQQHNGPHAIPPPPKPPDTPASATKFDQEKLVLDGTTKKDSANEAPSNCFLPPLNGLHGGTVAVADLQIPAKARSEYENACAAIRSKNLAEAEKHLRKAVKQYQNYPAAWVMLGQSLAAQQKTKEARDACSQPIADGSSNYLPAYLCVADISMRSQDWNEVLKLTTRLLEIDPTTDAVGYAYNAAANLNLHNLSKAEASALKAAEIDRNHSDPRVHFLLAQIYEAKGDSTNEAAQLREYLKYASDPNDVAMVTSYLSAIDTQKKK